MTLPATQPTPERTRPLRVHRKLRTALDAMVWQGLPYVEAARTAGMTAYAMRRALERGHVLAYVKAQRVVLRASLSAKNDLRLAEIRDAANNMPAVQAIRALEELDVAEQAARVSGNASIPGVVIRIVSAPDAAPAMIDVTPSASFD